MDKDFLDFYFNPTKNTEGETELTLGGNGSFDDYITGLLLKQGNMNSNTPGGILKDKNMKPYLRSPVDVPYSKEDVEFLSNKKNVTADDLENMLNPNPKGYKFDINSILKNMSEGKLADNIKNFISDTNKNVSEVVSDSTQDAKGTLSGIGDLIMNSDIAKKSKEKAQARKNTETMNLAPPGQSDANINLSDMIMSDDVIKILNTKPFKPDPIKNAPGGTGDQATGGNKSKEKKSDSKKEDDFEITLKDKPEPPSKIGMILNNLMSESPTFLTEIAKSLLAGKGLVPGIIEGSEKERDVDLATKKAAGAARSQSILDALNQAKAREALRPDEVIENANLYATQLGYPEGSEDYKKAFDEMVRLQVQNSGSGSQLANLITASTLAGGDLSKVGQDFLNNNPMGGNNTNNTNTTNGPEVIKGYTLS
tara:strand:- start:7870 stop:9141 length:1272 start_codon:yes stop_codon:yes gene_type:complete